MVCMDGFILTHAIEGIDVPEQKQAMSSSVFSEVSLSGNFTATADTNDNGVGTFTIGTGVILDSGGNVTINANQMFLLLRRE